MKKGSVVFAIVLVSGTNPAAPGAEPIPDASISRRVPAGFSGMLLAPALALATERLGTAECRQILEELPDFTGRPVARRLEQGERSISEHFARLRFLDSVDGPCRESLVAAWSVPGDVRVRLCPRAFGWVACRDRREAAALLIHEALHTLGVAENAAREPLTGFVRRRCDL